jgi:hypothetical protein
LPSLRDSYKFSAYPALRLPTPIRAKAARIGDPARLCAGLDYFAPTALVSLPLHSTATGKLQFSRRHWKAGPFKVNSIGFLSEVGPAEPIDCIRFAHGKELAAGKMREREANCEKREAVSQIAAFLSRTCRFRDSRGSSTSSFPARPTRRPDQCRFGCACTRTGRRWWEAK